MRDVFSVSDYKFAQLNAEQFAEQNLAESIETTSLEGNNRSSNTNISYIFKTRSINEVYINNESEKEAIKGVVLMTNYNDAIMNLLKTVSGVTEHLESLQVKLGKEILKRRMELGWYAKY